MTDIVVVVENQPEIVVVVQEGGAALTPSTIGPALSVLVANIDDPTTELAAIPGTLPAATLIIARQSRADADEVTLYLLDTASSDAAETPWRVNRTLGGQWIAVGGKYSNRQRRPVSSTDNTVARMDGTTGNLQGSGVAIDDSGNVTGVAALTCSDTITATGGASSVSLLIPAGNAVFRALTAVSTNTGYIDFPRLRFRDPSNSYAEGLALVNGRTLIAGATDDTTSALQVQGAVRATGSILSTGLGTILGDGAQSPDLSSILHVKRAATGAAVITLQNDNAQIAFGCTTAAFLGTRSATDLYVQRGGTNIVQVTASGVSILTATASTSTTTGALVVAGGVGVGGAINVGASSSIITSGNTLLTIGTTAAGGAREIQYTSSGGTKYNWSTGAQINIDQAYEITPSTAVGGSTFSAPSAVFHATSSAGQTRFSVYDHDNGTWERVTVGAADSGGAGFKVLRIPN